MPKRKTQYAWMALGGLICLFCLVLACKLRDGNKANAQAEPKIELPPFSETQNKVTPDASLPTKANRQTKAPELKSKPVVLSEPVLGFQTIEPEKVLPAKKTEAKSATTSAPKTTIPPTAGPVLPAIYTQEEKSPSLSPSLPAPSGPVLPVSFGPNTPSTAIDKAEKKKDPAASPLPPIVISAPNKAEISPVPPMFGPPTLSSSNPDKKQPTPSSLDSLRTLMKNTTGESSKETKLAPAAFAPSPTSSTLPSPSSGTDNGSKSQPGEPPLAPAPGPVQLYHVHGTETLQDIARRTLGSSERWVDLHKLNPTLKSDTPLSSGTAVRLPADACVQADDAAEPVKPLPALRPKPPAPKSKVLPLTGTYQCSLDEKGHLTLPRSLRDQLNASETVLLSPGPDKCLWLTNQAHLERLGERLEQSQASEADVRVFKRLYFAQTEKLSVNSDGRVALPERLAQFAGLHQEVVLVGIDDHFEVWDATRWRQYTQQKGTIRSSALLIEQE